jgi:hypothetical protein
MSKAALLDFIPDDRRKVIMHEEDGVTRVETRQDVSHIIAAAKFERETRTPGKDMRLVGFMPQAVLDDALREGWFHDSAAVKRWLNDPANACYRVWEGRA